MGEMSSKTRRPRRWHAWLMLLATAPALAACGALQGVKAPDGSAAALVGCPVPPPRPVWAAGPGFIWPLKGAILDRFGEKPDGSRNDGVTIAATACAPVLAMADGEVAYAGGGVGGLGQLVLIRHRDGFVSVYTHNRGVLVAANQPVRQGQAIALAAGGPAGFELRAGQDPVDPLAHLDDGMIQMATLDLVVADATTLAGMR